jgi:hypothetical protein
MTARPSSSLRALGVPTALEQEDRRDADRFPCALETTCQPPSAWATDPWPATIRDISNNGLSLTLKRRFERGSGLAIELPTEDGSTATVLARIIQVKPYALGGWLLGCAFISELSDEEVQSLLELDQLQHGTGQSGGRFGRSALRFVEDEDPDSSVSVAGVLFQARPRPGEVVRWYVKHLNLHGSWPLGRDSIVTLRIGGESFSLLVRKCAPLGEIWVVNARFKTEPPPQVLRALGCPV